ncbi:uncharacterized protein LOC120133603 [Hibiscus syriacus]|uniref:uncharacterized protein LOC120133603 n=1 Tax=Hibiscus syriacus TaxID=106335 RepID=UPI001921BCA3|nr:uncharacterized protein LOC120133603 [Hibiscus syriacus]
MVGFFFRQFLQHRSRIILGRSLRDLRVRLAGSRRRNRRALESLGAWEAAAAVMEERNRTIREELRRQFALNSLANLLVHDRLVEVENDPLMRDAFQRIEAQDLNLRDIFCINPPRPFLGYRRRRR